MSKKYFNKVIDDDGSKSKKLKTVTSDEKVSSDDFMNNLDEEESVFYENLEEFAPHTEGGQEFLLRGAKLRCHCGSHARMLNLPRCHGVYFEGHPLVRKEDCEVGDDKNITSFGVCSSQDNPEEKWFGDNVTLVQEDDPTKNVKGASCMPLIVDGEWKNTYDEFLITDDNGTEGSVILDSYLICAYGGLIEPETSGQENVDTENLNPPENINENP